MENTRNNPEIEDVTELLANYKKLVNKIARKYFLIGAESEDLVQEGMIGLFTAITNYKSSHKASFSTFATLCIERQIKDAIKHANRQKNQMLNDFIEISEDGRVIIKPSEESGENSGLYIPSLAPTPEEMYLENERLKEITMAINRVLSGYEKKILSAYVDGESITGIANTLETSNKSVSNALSRIKAKLSFLKKGEI